jgi:ribosomal protein S8
MAYWIFSDGKRAITSNGANIIFNSDTPEPTPISDGLKRILLVRSLINDPDGAQSVGITYSAALPDVSTLAEGAIVTTGNGVYHQVKSGEYVTLSVKFSDAAIDSSGKSGGLTFCLKPEEYITSFSTGGQSTSFGSYTEYLTYFDRLQNAIAKIYGVKSPARYNGPRVRYDGCWN